MSAKAGLSSMRERWDIYWASGGAFSNASEYHYLNDNHIDSALKSILKEYLEKNPAMVPATVKSLNPKLEPGNWPPYNVKYIVSNVEKVFKTRNIGHLSKGAYHFITLHMGFIAHFNLQGFQNSYQDIEHFARRLQTSEYSSDYDYNLREAQRQETDRQFNEWYGSKYNKSVAEGIRGIVAVARKYYPGRGTARMLNPSLPKGKFAMPVIGYDGRKFALFTRIGRGLHPIGESTFVGGTQKEHETELRKSGYKVLRTMISETVAGGGRR